MMVLLSLLLNILVLVPVTASLIADAHWTHDAYGTAAPARGILLSVYAAILLLSLALLFLRDPKLVAALLLVQVLYKVTTPLTVGTLRNPVVISNLAIAAVHLVTLATLWRDVFQRAGPSGV